MCTKCFQHQIYPFLFGLTWFYTRVDQKYWHLIKSIKPFMYLGKNVPFTPAKVIDSACQEFWGHAEKRGKRGVKIVQTPLSGYLGKEGGILRDFHWKHKYTYIDLVKNLFFK